MNGTDGPLEPPSPSSPLQPAQSPSPTLAPSRRPATASTTARDLRRVIWVAVAVRVALFPFAENKQADAPMRALLAEHMNADAAAAADARSFCQFGPLPIELLRPFMAIDPDPRRSSRWLSLLAGIAAFAPFIALGRRMVGGGPGGGPALVVATLALALSPVNVQVSTTAASEALYLLLFLAALERFHAALSAGRRRDFILAGLLTSLAAVTRYDTWLAAPVAAGAALLLARRDRGARLVVDLALYLCSAAILPAAYLLWSWSTSGDPFFFARYITRDHAALAGAAVARLGAGLARARQLGIWVVSFAVVMTPVPFLAAPLAMAMTPGWRRWSPATRVVVVTALAPTAAYLAKGLLFGDFEPLPRFAIAPGAVLLPLAAAALVDLQRRWPPLRPVPMVAAGALATAALASGLAFARPGRIWGGAESVAPVTRLDAEDRELAEYLVRNRSPQEGVFIDTWDYLDIVIAHAARVPAHLTATLAHTREPGRTMAESRRLTGASWFAVHDASWAKLNIPDWPRKSQRLGHWTLAHARDLR